ncbi:MAG TPA: glutamine--fructose-6-phosphate transaminase (isomerizing) [Nitrosopumilaceae archaeon]|nr:glutamine--fructose-6-phosphate transaminase (isomerizing) [Nitrosopumilaceae archaeon]
MCSIIGYIGSNKAAPVIIQGLKRMEYRGYDSVGIATFSDNQILIKKGVGKVDQVNSTSKLDTLSGNIGIGHTRWATHGGVTSANAHPHQSSSSKIAIVHNGIIDNFTELKKDLKQKGFLFKSETDSEVIANLLQYEFDQTKNVKKSMLQTVGQLVGNYSFVAVFDNGMIAAARFHEPLIVGIGKEGYFVSSDVLGFVGHTNQVIYPDNREFVIINTHGIQMFDFDGNPVRHQITKISKEFADSYKGEYAHYTIKEISEQPRTILKAGHNTKIELDLVVDLIKQAKNMFITGSGTSYNAALVAKHIFSKYAKLKIESLISSEIPYSPNFFDDQSILIALSQSGESADVLEAANIAQNDGTKIISIVNMMTSSLANMSAISIGLDCGPEIGVAATKSFTSQLAVLYQLTDKLCGNCLGLDLNEISQTMSKTLLDHSKIIEIAKQLKNVSDIYILGRGIHYPIACEASLKIKELTYIHAEGLPGGELKHGPLALMDSNVYVIIINPHDSTYDNTLTSAHEIKARGAKIIGISDKPSDVYDFWVQIPTIGEAFYPLIEIIPIQLLAYYAALEKNADPDYPRNLAKSVTVK